MIYPTLFDDPEQKRIYKKQCDYPGGIFSLDFNGGKAGGFRLPAQSAHRPQRRVAGRRRNADLPPQEHHAFRHDGARSSTESGVTDGLVRVSVGIEDWRDLLADFEQALEHVA